MILVGVGGVGGAVLPVPVIASVLVPPVASQATVSVPLYVCAAVGVNVTVTVADAPAATVPLVGLAVIAAVPVLKPVHVSVPLPLFPIVTVAVALVPTVTLPKPEDPESEITRVVVGVGVAAVGVEDVPPLQPAAITASSRATRRLIITWSLYAQQTPNAARKSVPRRLNRCQTHQDE